MCPFFDAFVGDKILNRFCNKYLYNRCSFFGCFVGDIDNLFGCFVVQGIYITDSKGIEVPICAEKFWDSLPLPPVFAGGFRLRKRRDLSNGSEDVFSG